MNMFASYICIQFRTPLFIMVPRNATVEGKAKYVSGRGDTPRYHARVVHSFSSSPFGRYSCFDIRLSYLGVHRIAVSRRCLQLKSREARVIGLSAEQEDRIADHL